jgi:DNA mismatch repair protein MutL
VPGQTFPSAPRPEGTWKTTPGGPGPELRYLGQVFGVFLVFELPRRLLILDQHAAHERIIFERLRGGGVTFQEMLFPLSFDASTDEEKRIDENRQSLRELGIEVRRAGPRAFEVTALSHDLVPVPEETLVEMIRSAGGEEWRNSLLARAACSLAIKEGDAVDPVTARELCARALELPVPRCPHGRPIWHELPEEMLRRLVDRPMADRAKRDIR